MDQPRIMFVTYGAGHADIVAHLLPELARVSAVPPVVLALTTAAGRLEGSACTLQRCVDYLQLPGYQGAAVLGAEVVGDGWSAGSPVSYEETCAYHGVSMVDLVADLGPDKAWAHFREKGRGAFCPVDFMTRVLEAERPDIVVTTCHVRMEKAAVLAARNLGIRSVRIEDLLGYSLLGAYPYGQRGNLLPASEWPDMAVVMNDAVRDIVIGNGFPADRVAALGQPVISSWFNRHRGPEVPALFPTSAPVVTYMTTPRDEILWPQSDIWLDLARRRPDLNFVIKLHPSTVLDDYLSRVGPVPGNLKVLAKEDAIDVVLASDLVVLYRSTVGISCLATGTPMIVWSTLDEPEVLPYVSSGAAQEVADDAKLEPTIDAMLSAAATGQSAPHPLFAVTATAAADIAAWLMAGAPSVGDEGKVDAAAPAG